MSAGTIVGYITHPNGSPISGAEIWISQAGEFGIEAEIKSAVKTDSRGYFQLAFTGGDTDIAEVGGKLNISVGARKNGRTNGRSSVASENRFQVNGYLIKETLKPNA